jgi:hypothetical protein
MKVHAVVFDGKQIQSGSVVTKAEFCGSQFGWRSDSKANSPTR